MSHVLELQVAVSCVMWVLGTQLGCSKRSASALAQGPLSRATRTAGLYRVSSENSPLWSQYPLLVFALVSVCLSREISAHPHRCLAFFLGVSPSPNPLLYV